jgi:hypothetical protein
MTDTDKKVRLSFRKWLQKNKDRGYFVITEHDLERCAMAELRDCLGFSGTAYFSTLGRTEQV